MNIYFLVEGKTEAKIYPEWLSHLLPELTKVKYYDLVVKNNYYLFKGNGYPHIIDVHLPKAIEDVNAVGLYDYIVMSLDADESTVSERVAEVNQHVLNLENRLTRAKLILIVQNRCIETWLLGNRKIYKHNPQDPTLVQYTKFYNVLLNDPELMGKYPGFSEHQQFHKAYFKLLCRERRINYSERHPRHVIDKSYLDQLLARIDDTSHLATFRHFIDFCRQIRRHLTKA
ncbi:MAG: hypothetical protein ACPGWR_14255 [Ardenticatenaceae bacterium]